MNTGTPASNNDIRKNPRQQQPRGSRSGSYSRQIAAALIAAFALAIVATALLLVTPSAQAQMVTNNAATGLPGIRYQDRPNDDIRTMRPGTILIADISNIADADGLTNPGWMYQWAHRDASGTITDIAGATSNTYLIEDDDIGKSFVLKVTFEDDAGTTEGP